MNKILIFLIMIIVFGSFVCGREATQQEIDHVKQLLEQYSVQYATQYGFDPAQFRNYVFAVAEQESNFNQYAESDAHAKGVMQLMDGTADGLGVTNVFDPEKNIDAGVRYLATQLDTANDFGTVQIKGKSYTPEQLALVGYHCGPGCMKGLAEDGEYTYKNGKIIDDVPESTKKNIELVFKKAGGSLQVAACFLPTTLISTPTNQVQIQDIRVGDSILSFDIIQNIPIISKVLHVFSHEENNYMIINNKMKVTPYHYVYARKR